jgi:beta-glucosidase
MEIDYINQNNPMTPYKNRNLPIQDRIMDLVGRMTLEEKARQIDQYSGMDWLTKKDGDPVILWDEVEKAIGTLGAGSLQMRNSTPEINNEIQRYALEKTRLGIPFLFSEEGLHGFPWPGCTIFPQQIALAGTFMPELAEKTGHSIATEARSFGVHEIWGPVVDLGRDPRWGRVEEGYGEDTYLSSRMAAAIVKGMQGDDVSRPDRVVSEPKHFSGYGVPIGGINCAPAAIGAHEHHSHYLPPFEAAFVEGGAMNTMCSYSSIDGVPCPSDYHLLTEVLREQWGMRGFVRSDMCAVSMLHTGHDVADSEQEAIRMALEAGVDMQLYDFSHELYQSSIINMIKDGVLKEEVVDRAVSRVLWVKFTLGLFDNPYTDTTLRKSVVRCEKHQQLALEVARKAVCLLKNSGNLLPLKKDVGSIAVIGPSAAEPRLGDYCARPEGFKAITLLEGIKTMVSSETKVHYARGCNILESELMAVPGHWLRNDQGTQGLKGEYFNNNKLEGKPVLTRVDSQINFNWIYSKPSESVNANLFSVRWTGKLVPDRSFDGYLGTSSMDSMRLWIDDKLVTDSWGDKKGNVQMAPFHFEEGMEYELRVEYRNDARGARVVLGWSFGSENINEAVKVAASADVAIVALGDSEETSGENFDRADLNLPGRQLELLKAVFATGTPVVLVLQNGRPLSITWEAENIPAIVEAWYPGEKGGQAIAEVLFGDVNPSGRLPMSFPKSVGQLPVHYSRRPAGGLKYIEMDKQALFPFGFGLSYTHFTYENLETTPSSIHGDEEVVVTFEVTNRGSLAGEEVAQLYVRDCYGSVVRPFMELKGFKRIYLVPGEKKKLEFKLGFKELKLLNLSYQWVVEPGQFKVMVGPDSHNIKLAGSFEVIDLKNRCKAVQG